MSKLIGIYKITSPSGKIYIGQSANIKERISYYKNYRCNRQPKLYASLKKYGFENHRIEIIHLLPSDAEYNVLIEYEILYIECYRLCGADMLNLTIGGEGLKNPSDSTREKLRQASKGKTFSEESRKKGLAVRVANGVSKETREKRSKSLMGRASPMKGKKHNPESCKKIGDIWRGKKQSRDHAEKRAKVWIGRKHTEESKHKMSVSAKGRKIGLETRKKLSEANKGKKFSVEILKNRSASRRANKIKRMNNFQLF